MTDLTRGDHTQPPACQPVGLRLGELPALSFGKSCGMNSDRPNPAGRQGTASASAGFTEEEEAQSAQPWGAGRDTPGSPGSPASGGEELLAAGGPGSQRRQDAGPGPGRGRLGFSNWDADGRQDPALSLPQLASSPPPSTYVAPHFSCEALPSGSKPASLSIHGLRLTRGTWTGGAGDGAPRAAHPAGRGCGCGCGTAHWSSSPPGRGHPLSLQKS